MAFISIDAKADLQGQKKGKITPAQHAILNAWSLSSKTGILDFPQDHSKPGRCEATVLNITNIQNYETEIVFNKGYLVICGRLVECEDQTRFTFKTPVSGTENGKIVARFYLSSSGSEEFNVVKKIGSLTQQDLNDKPDNGIYEFELYSYTATPTTLTLVRNNTNYIPDIGGKLAQFEASLKDEGKPLHGYDDSKGTIEDRLTKLGFKQGSVTLSSGTATVNTVNRQGNYCILNLKIDNIGSYAVNKENNIKIGTITSSKNINFFPVFDIKCIAVAIYSNYPAGPTNVILDTTINKSGEIYAVIPKLSNYNSTVTFGNFELKNIGYEAKPL